MIRFVYDRNKKIIILGIIVVLSLITACSKSNPLLGKWTLDKRGLFTDVLQNEEKYELEFTEDYMKIGEKKINVDYKIKDEKTILLFSNGYMSTVSITSNESILFKSLRSTRKYQRK